MAEDMKRVASIVLSGGEGRRLYPLTKYRCKPTLPFAQCKLIDIPISNSLHANIRKIFVITQFLSASLHGHLLKTYRLDSYSHGFLQLLTPEQKPMNSSWYKGTADSVRQNLDYLRETPVDFFLILSGDQLYNIDFKKMIHFAQSTDADLTIAAQPIDEVDAKRMGVLQVNENAAVTDFYEKPQDSIELSRFFLKPSYFKKREIKTEPKNCFLGSMGIYVFKRQALFDLLEENSGNDFGCHLIPEKVKSGKVSAFLYDGYWEDIGTIESFYKASLALTHQDPRFNSYNESYLIYTSHPHLPGPKIKNAKISESIICDGALIEAKEVAGSILGERTIIKKGTVIKDSVIFGNDYYSPPLLEASCSPKNLYIDRDCVIKKAILDKNVHLGRGVQLINKDNLLHYDGDNIYIRDGITIVPQGTSLPDGFVL
jgi:glucose-1-phosphate adenylyltransferase